jgi:hypothetical protein
MLILVIAGDISLGYNNRKCQFNQFYIFNKKDGSPSISSLIFT